MPFIRQTISLKSRYGIMACALLFSTAIVFTAVGFGSSKSDPIQIATSNSIHPAASVAVVFQGNSSTTRLDAERVTVRSTGIEPAEINRPAGRFLLAVNDRTGSDGLTLTLARDTGQQLHTTRMRDNPRKHQWRQVMNLPPGRYLLREASHPEWTCRITLTSN